MDMSDSHVGHPPRSVSDDETHLSYWRRMVSDAGAEIAGPLSAALEHIHALTTTGHIDRAALRNLRDEVEQARQVGIAAQQLSRFAAGHMRQSHERLALADTVTTVMTHRARETQTRGIQLKLLLKPVDVVIDASLFFSLLNTMVDWAVANTSVQIDFSIEVKTWPAMARLLCSFNLLSNEALNGKPLTVNTTKLDSMVWRLLEQTALTMNLPLTRSLQGHRVELALSFPRTVNDQMQGVSMLELDEGFAPSGNSKPLAGSHVLVIASRRDMRVQVRDATRHMGLIVDMVSSVNEARDFCREGLPHAVIFESILNGSDLAELRAELLLEIADFPFIEITEHGSDHMMSGFGGAEHAFVGRDALQTALPSVLMYELSKSL